MGNRAMKAPPQEALQRLKNADGAFLASGKMARARASPGRERQWWIELDAVRANWITARTTQKGVDHDWRRRHEQKAQLKA